MEMGIYRLNLARRIEKLKQSDISDTNKSLIQSFVHFCVVTGIGEHRILKYISTLKCIAISIQTDFDKVDLECLQSYVATLEQSDYSEHTKHDYKVTIKKFYRWHYDDENPKLIKWIKARINTKRCKSPEAVLNEPEVLQLIDISSNRRDKALIALLWDIGGRIGEIGTLLIKHVLFDDMGAVIHVNGKTGPRRVRAVFSVQYLKEWISEHPGKDDPEAPLWIKLNSGSKVVMLQYGAIRMQLIKIAKRAGTNKRIHAHLFRHSRATHMANYLTEFQMCQYFGWTLGSDMPATYVHLSGRDVDDAVLKANGVKQGESSFMNEYMGNLDVSDIDVLVEQKLKSMMLKLLT
ncbi:site-specific recombinase XerD [Methanolobus tindarius DSM 2278]|uniref:Site-specific recombinase XerD n=1 Tax=Methanolobus tindarius DSM 2278 TaxID=1090322 RepID=W9DST5_METTI|nr:tyrosine-type recombinase/integrase [Methanolobus tindarius]ETA68863.1 site-specific recombinase XerD [Methanolobus tindarius DSM 2278]